MRNHHQPWFVDGRRRVYPLDFDRALARLSAADQLRVWGLQQEQRRLFAQYFENMERFRVDFATGGA